MTCTYCGKPLPAPPKEDKEARALLSHYPPDCRDENLLAMCNTCHLRYDQVLHSHHAFLKRRQDKAIGDMFGHNERYEGKQ